MTITNWNLRTIGLLDTTELFGGIVLGSPRVADLIIKRVGMGFDISFTTDAKHVINPNCDAMNACQILNALEARACNVEAR